MQPTSTTSSTCALSATHTTQHITQRTLKTFAWRSVCHSTKCWPSILSQHWLDGEARILTELRRSSIFALLQLPIAFLRTSNEAAFVVTTMGDVEALAALRGALHGALGRPAPPGNFIERGSPWG